jgi:hypothetical protein
MRRTIALLSPLLLVLPACGDDRDSMEGMTTGLTGDSTDSGGDDDGSGDRLDLSTNEDVPGGGDGPPTCKVNPDGNGVGECDEVAPPDSFEPDVQWEFLPDNGMGSYEGAEIYSFLTPLVANLTDDNGDDEIDLCDTPDVVVITSAKMTQPALPAHMWILDGATGVPHVRFEKPVAADATPAIADLDADGTPEIIAQTFAHGGEPPRLVAFEPDGTVRWESDVSLDQIWYPSSVAVADADNDGDPEILFGDRLFDHEGKQLWQSGIQLMIGDVPTFADLDGDGDQEIVHGHAAYHHDGSLYYSTNLQPGFPAIGDIDQDGEPEVILTNRDGISVLEHDGKIKFQSLTPTGVAPEGLNWSRPATVHNFDQDPEPEFAMSSRDYYTVYDGDGTIVWSSEVLDASGYAAGTAFDFLGDGEAEAMYADESSLFIYDGQGNPVLTSPRASHTLHEYPVVADIDNDGSAEILVASEERGANGPGQNPTIPTVVAIRDVDDRWIQARRIWNQHTYHVTNVREDATIPQFEEPNWKTLNTFRTNAQLHSGGGVCKPKPQG